MTKVVSPSEMTPITLGQAAKFLDIQMAALRKSGLPSEPTQQVLESQGATLADEFVAAVRKRVEAMSKLIVRRVRVNRNRTPQQVLDATGRKQYTDSGVVEGMPRGEGEEVDVYFFSGHCYLSDAELEKDFDLCGLKPDPYAQAAVNEADPTFADQHPNCTHWRDANGKWCYATFSRWRGGGRGVGVYRGGSGWDGGWWFAGVRK